MNKLKLILFTLFISATMDTMAMEKWQLLPKKGIATSEITLQLGMSRDDVKQLFAKTDLKIDDSNFDNEDDYEANDGEWIRCRFDKNKLVDIEVLNANLTFDGVALHKGTTIDAVKSALASKSSVRDAEWLGDGLDFVDLGINIASHEDVGGDGSGIEWVILSKNFK